jgi:hypothetical protein
MIGADIFGLSQNHMHPTELHRFVVLHHAKTESASWTYHFHVAFDETSFAHLPMKSDVIPLRERKVVLIVALCLHAFS